MPAPVLTSKLCLPPSRPRIVHRARLIDRLHEGSSARCRCARETGVVFLPAQLLDTPALPINPGGFRLVALILGDFDGEGFSTSTVPCRPSDKSSPVIESTQVRS